MSADVESVQTSMSILRQAGFDGCDVSLILGQTLGGLCNALGNLLFLNVLAVI
jgi:hypothetical protein